MILLPDIPKTERKRRWLNNIWKQLNNRSKNNAQRTLGLLLLYCRQWEHISFADVGWTLKICIQRRQRFIYCGDGGQMIKHYPIFQGRDPQFEVCFHSQSIPFCIFLNFLGRQQATEVQNVNVALTQYTIWYKSWTQNPCSFFKLRFQIVSVVFFRSFHSGYFQGDHM